jgi:hypothetical protein
MTRLDVLGVTVIALMYRTAVAFMGPLPRFRMESLSVTLATSEYTLEGKTIQKPFTPVNNMLLLKKADIIDQTGGGIFLTGKVCTMPFHDTCIVIQHPEIHNVHIMIPTISLG